MGLGYKTDEGEGAFYGEYLEPRASIIEFSKPYAIVVTVGPKIDIGVTDAIGRTWQCSTIQCDFNMPERFGLQYASADNSAAARPIMLHRAIFGSLERFIGLLIEHYAGDFPLWLAPTQLRLLPISAGASCIRCCLWYCMHCTTHKTRIMDVSKLLPFESS